MLYVVPRRDLEGERKQSSQGSRVEVQAGGPGGMQELKEYCVTVGTCADCDLELLSVLRPFVSCCWLHGLY